MDWRRVLAYITGTVDDELLLRNEYLVAENRNLMEPLKGRLRLTGPDAVIECHERLGGLLRYYHRMAA